MYRKLGVTLLVAFGFVAGACGGDDGGEAGGEAADTTAAPEMEDEHEGGAFAFGEPADAAEASRVIEVSMLDAMRFDPSEIDVTAGETVTFRVVNIGQLDHDFTLGDEATQQEHEEEMAQAGGTEMHEDPNAVTVEPGQTKELTWRFTRAGELIYGCHIPGHYAAGMLGTITIS